jgi:hypothetical protein
VKAKRTFADIDSARRRYNPEVEGYGSAKTWTGAFRERMGFEEAERIVSEGRESPRAILGLGRDCTWADVKAAYRIHAMACHPDRIVITGMSLEEATRAFKEIVAAFAVLAREFGE